MVATKQGICAALIGVTILFSQFGCDQKPVSVTDPTAEVPGRPFALQITVGDRQVKLVWSINKPASVARYKIYRKESELEGLTLLDTSAVRNYVDRSAKNGITYFYAVSAVSKGGIEGLRSETISGRPGLFAMQINNGAEYTASQDVQVSLVVPALTDLMKVNNDSLFENANWQAVQTAFSWRLAAGDGTKTLYATFRDQSGNETISHISDSIILDTIAAIAGIQENTNGAAKTKDDVIHLKLIANEPEGVAAIDILGGPQGIQLFDNGSRGDAVAHDGVYEVDYSIPPDLEVAQAKLIGNFRDRVGNVATPFIAAGTLTVLKAPDPVNLFQPLITGAAQNILRLSWSESREADFTHYAIYRSTRANFTAGPAELLARIGNIRTTTFDDGNLAADVTYYYKVLVFDANGLASLPSNEVQGRLNPDLPPVAVNLNSPLLLGDGTGSVQLTWTKSNEVDFAGYRVYRSFSPAVDSLSVFLSAVANINSTVYKDENLEASTTYYYRVYVYDQAGNATGSNTVNVTTEANRPPVPVTLAQPAALDTVSLGLSWSQSNDGDFASYRIYRSSQPGVTTSEPPVAILNSDPRNTSYVDSGLRPKTTYYYRVFVFDKGNLSAGSNEVKGTTR